MYSLPEVLHKLVINDLLHSASILERGQDPYPYCLPE
jgi:hypothetical protein